MFIPKDAIGYKTIQRDVTFNVIKAIVRPFTPQTKAYTGENQVADIPVNAIFEATINDGGTDVGEYEVVCTLLDISHYRWSTDHTANNPDCTTYFSIVKADIEVSGTPIVQPLAYGQYLTDEEIHGEHELTAAEMISGLTLGLSGMAVSGKWVWDLTSLPSSQPLNASDPNDSDDTKKGDGHQVSATFMPESGNLIRSQRHLQ